MKNVTKTKLFIALYKKVYNVIEKAQNNLLVLTLY